MITMRRSAKVLIFAADIIAAQGQATVPFT